MNNIPSIYFQTLDEKSREMVPYISELVQHDETTDFTLTLTYDGDSPLNKGDVINYRVTFAN